MYFFILEFKSEIRFCWSHLLVQLEGKPVKISLITHNRILKYGVICEITVKFRSYWGTLVQLLHCKLPTVYWIQQAAMGST